MLLQRFKTRFPSVQGPFHRLFISTYMISCKVLCDINYKNEDWPVIAKKLFSLQEINQMEREMCCHLDWQLHFDQHAHATFRRLVLKDFSSDTADRLQRYPTTPKECIDLAEEDETSHVRASTDFECSASVIDETSDNSRHFKESIYDSAYSSSGPGHMASSPQQDTHVRNHKCKHSTSRRPSPTQSSYIPPHMSTTRATTISRARRGGHRGIP